MNFISNLIKPSNHRSWLHYFNLLFIWNNLVRTNDKCDYFIQPIDVVNIITIFGMVVCKYNYKIMDNMFLNVVVDIITFITIILIGLINMYCGTQYGIRYFIWLLAHAPVAMFLLSMNERVLPLTNNNETPMEQMPIQTV